MTRFICISGKAQHGKDTSAMLFRDMLAARGYKVIITHYADLLKFICKGYFGWDGEKDEKGRTLLQTVGTNNIRECNPNYWVDFIAGIVKMFPNEWDYIIIPDTRFPNEIDRLKEHGFECAHFRVRRNGFDNHLTEAQKNHASETALDFVVPDMFLDNDSIPTLKCNIERICGSINKIFSGILMAEGA